MQRIRNQKGFSLAEAMLVVGIIMILAGVTFTGVTGYMRDLTKLEYDGYAREIFIAAQNHLTMAHSQGYLGRTDFGEEDGDVEGVYYYVVAGAHEQLYDRDGVLSLMLPVASVDETLRFGMSYIVRYQKELGQVMDVFCWSETTGRYPYRQTADYEGFLANKNNKDVMSRYGSERSVIGYYGGVEAENLTRGEELAAPAVTVVNAETLYVVVRNPNYGVDGAKLKLVVTGKTSGKVWETELTASGVSDRYTVVLDDITSASTRFRDRAAASHLIPGENIVIQAVAYNNAALSNVAYSAEYTTNSLFASGSTTDTAKIAYFRHLENLDAERSGVPYWSAEGVRISKAEQLNDLVWSGLNFADAADPGFAFAPVNIPSEGSLLQYDGKAHSIDGLTIGGTEDAGVFGTFEGTSISNLRLIDIAVSGANVGALAGQAETASIENVLAFNSHAERDATIVGTAASGGLIGKASGCSVERCAAALVVRSSGGDAGGLIGTAVDGTELSACYSGGHTVNGMYSAAAYNVTGATAAGGLVGSLTGGSAAYSYSTCSAQGAYAGGFAGKSTGALSHCYATGLVSGDEGREGAFAGQLSASASNCLYFSIINARDVEGGTNGSGGYTYLAPVGGEYGGSGIAALDADAATYDGFVGAPSAWADAVTYDPTLSLYYKNTYNLKTVSRLGASVDDADFVSTHYGDWPAPETFAVNVPSA